MRRASGGHQARPRRPAARPTAGAAACFRGRTATRCGQLSCMRSMKRLVCLPVHNLCVQNHWQSLAPTHRVIVTPLASGTCETHLMQICLADSLNALRVGYLQSGAADAACGTSPTLQFCVVW